MYEADVYKGQENKTCMGQMYTIGRRTKQLEDRCVQGEAEQKRKSAYVYLGKEKKKESGKECTRSKTNKTA